ncbi:MAG: hypothetical protein PHQ12_01980 [Chthoniobacteraceae bacterium]|nr:hypothetical protein [Chthoniobacteraceae bacterium]
MKMSARPVLLFAFLLGSLGIHANELDDIQKAAQANEAAAASTPQPAPQTAASAEPQAKDSLDEIQKQVKETERSAQDHPEAKPSPKASASAPKPAKRETDSPVRTYHGVIRVVKCTDTNAICQDVKTGRTVICTPRFRGAKPGMVVDFAGNKILRQTEDVTFVTCNAKFADPSPYHSTTESVIQGVNTGVNILRQLTQ